MSHGAIIAIDPLSSPELKSSNSDNWDWDIPEGAPLRSFGIAIYDCKEAVIVSIIRQQTRRRRKAIAACRFHWTCTSIRSYLQSNVVCWQLLPNFQEGFTVNQVDKRERHCCPFTFKELRFKKMWCDILVWRRHATWIQDDTRLRVPVQIYCECVTVTHASLFSVPFFSNPSGSRAFHARQAKE